MSNAWNTAQGLLDKHGPSGGGLFVRLSDDGDKVVGAFVGDPLAREVHWTGAGYKECTGDDCPICKEGKKPGMRVTFNFYVPAEGKMKAIEGSRRWFKSLLEVREKFDLDEWLFEVKRSGRKGDTETRYTILPEHQIDDALRAKIDAAKLHDLEGMVSGKGGDRFDSYDKDDDGPIDDRTVAELMPRLKSLPRTALDGWLEKLSIGKVRELKMRELKKASALLAELERSLQPATATSQEIDPFA